MYFRPITLLVDIYENFSVSQNPAGLLRKSMLNSYEKDYFASECIV